MQVITARQSCSEILTKERGPTGPSILAVVVAVIGFTPLPRVAWPAVAPGIPLLIYNALPSILTGQFTAVICSKSTHTHRASTTPASCKGKTGPCLKHSHVSPSVRGKIPLFRMEKGNYPLFPQGQKKPHTLETMNPGKRPGVGGSSCMAQGSWTP